MWPFCNIRRHIKTRSAWKVKKSWFYFLKLKCLFLSREWVYTYLNLLDSKVKKSEIIPDRDGTFGTPTAHACPQTTIQLDYYQLIQHLFNVNQFGLLNICIRFDLQWIKDFTLLNQLFLFMIVGIFGTFPK